MEESKIQSYLIRELKKKGWFVRKIARTNSPGDPDIFTYKDGCVVWIETKKSGRIADPLQEYKRKEIVSYGMESIVIAGIEEAYNYISSI